MEPKKNLDIFKLTFLDTLKEKNITCVVLHENTLIVGDDKGTIKQYQISDTKFEHKNTYQLYKKIEQILYVPQINIIYVNSGNAMTILSSSLEEKLKGDKVISEPIMKIASNEHRENVTDFLTVTKKKKVKFFRFNHEVCKAIQQGSKKEVTVPEIPDLLNFYGRWICYFIESKHKIYFYDISQGQESFYDVTTTCIKHVKGSWLTYTEGIGLFMDSTGPKSANPFMFKDNAKFICFEQYNSYILSLHEKLLEVHDINDSTQVQEINIDTGDSDGKFLCVSQNKVLIICQLKNGSEYRVWKLDELPFEDQIKMLLMNYQFEEALTILNNNINAQTETKPNLMEAFFVDCGWMYMKKLTKEGLDKAKDYFHIANLDIFALIYMFINLLDVQPIHDSYRDKPINLLKQTQFELLIKAEEQNKSKVDLITVDEAINFLINVLQSKRQYFLRTYDCSKPMELDIQSCNFIHSVHSPVQLSDHKKVTVLNTIKMINCTLVKAYVKTNQAKLCAEIIDNDKLGTDYLADGFLEKGELKHNKMALALIHENRGDYEKALTIWKTFAEDKIDPSVSRPARDRTIKILKGLKEPKHKEIYKKHISWMLPIFQELSFEIILENQELLDIDFVLNELIPKIDGTEDQRLKERFLSFVNKKEKYVNEKLQTQLIKFYIERLFNKHKKEDATQLTESANNKQYEELKEFVKSNTLYNKAEILGEVQNSWMADIEIYLYSQLGKFNDALNKLIETGKKTNSFTDVMSFCKKNLYKEPSMYNNLFSKLCNEYQIALQNQTKDGKNPDNEALIAFLKAEILKLLQNFIDNTLIDENDEHKTELEMSRFQMLDPFRVIGEIPNEWKLSEEIIFNYFNLIMKEYSHMNHKYTIMKNCCEIDLLYKQIDLADQRANYVLITDETECGLCSKKIGNTLFTVYPNKKIYHSKCVSNASPNVDPISKIDFTKDFV